LRQKGSVLSRAIANFAEAVPAIFLATVLMLFSEGVFALTLVGEVVAVADGDTVTVLDSGKRQHRVRLAGIDAPEKRQAFGNSSRQALASMVFRQRVVVESQKVDRYGRLIGKVFLGNVDVNLALLNLGLAWHYKDYQSEQSAEDRLSYSKAESVARRGEVGLWQDKNPTPPWDFRRQR
jgi:endonuclease YncB( thermonuclease family)